MKFTFLSLESIETNLWTQFWGPITAGVIVSLFTVLLALLISYLTSRQNEKKLFQRFNGLVIAELKRAIVNLSESCPLLRAPEKPSYGAIMDLVTIMTISPCVSDGFTKVQLVVYKPEGLNEQIDLDLEKKNDLGRLKKTDESDHFHLIQEKQAEKLKEIPFHYIARNLDKTTLLSNAKCFLLYGIYTELIVTNTMINQCLTNPNTTSIIDRTTTQYLKTMAKICDFLGSKFKPEQQYQIARSWIC